MVMMLISVNSNFKTLNENLSGFRTIVLYKSTYS